MALALPDLGFPGSHFPCILRPGASLQDQGATIVAYFQHCQPSRCKPETEHVDCVANPARPDPSWRDALTSFDSHFALLKILLLLPITPIKKPFSSMLYEFEGSTLYWLTLSTRRSKDSLY